MFATERKLKPIVKHREPVGFGTTNEVNIQLHVISGQNIPLRHSFVENYK